MAIAVIMTMIASWLLYRYLAPEVLAGVGQRRPDPGLSDCALRGDALIENLNKLIENNEQVAANARMRATSLAHTIKTPMAVLKNQLATLQDGSQSEVDWPAIQTSLAKIERMSQFYLMRDQSDQRTAQVV